MATASAFTPQSAWVRRSVTSRVIVQSEEAAPGASEVAPVAPVTEEAAPAAEAPVEKLTIETIEVGATYEGTVKNVAEFGAFVNFGLDNQDGLVHKSQLADDFVANPADIVSAGQVVSVRVLTVDIEKKQISLSMKSESSADSAPRERKPRSNGPDLTKYAAMSPEEVMEGVVRTVAAYGAFVDFPDGVTGLVHISQLADGRTESSNDVVSEGDTVKVRVLAAEAGKLSLTMRTFDANAPDEKPRERRPRENGPAGRGAKKEFIDDIWSDNTEPKWIEFQTEVTGAKETQYDNVLELKF
eukprot:CAMPEP_0171646820 /NCGR_PEP_ID=MMETSP0990-20121206/35035_1 /TAXON_ID=483369 /ORGANISM="non described non described, Strain CCMP2098" /LENGTH=298 /DNA_ID=CAMNT_0012223819 /DNA_START=63 /DNA_END=959 /DNA_ORIENTATION=+